MPGLARGDKEKNIMKWKVSHLQASPRGSRSLFYSLGLACAFSGVEKYIRYKEFNRQRGARRNLQGGLGARGWAGGERGTGNRRLQAERLQRKRRKGREVGAQREPGAASWLLPGSF